MERRRLIFLDIDGVLNSQMIADEWYARDKKGGYGGWFKEEDKITKEDLKWGHTNLQNLRELVEVTDAEIVISSDWRKNFSVEKFKEMFALYGWKNPPIIGKTEILNNRGLEVYKWLSDDDDVYEYVILDDNDWFLPDQLHNFVHTNPECGLTWNDVQDAIQILTKTKIKAK